MSEHIAASLDALQSRVEKLESIVEDLLGILLSSCSQAEHGHSHDLFDSVDRRNLNLLIQQLSPGVKES